MRMRRMLAGLMFAGLAGCAAVPLLPPDSSRAESVCNLALGLEGKPYRFGGRTPSGFDCSGFVQYVFFQATGFKLPRTSQAQFRLGQAVGLGAEKPSDLIFFDIAGAGRPTHVGIYLGRGKFIHAPRTGGGVKVSDANEPYWQHRRIGLRRLLTP